MDFDSPVQTFHPDLSPLQLAVQNGQVEVVKLLLANFRNCGIHPHRITKNTNENLLHLACGSPNTTKELIETLLDREPFDKMLGNSKWKFFENLIPTTPQINFDFLFLNVRLLLAFSRFSINSSTIFQSI